MNNSNEFSENFIIENNCNWFSIDCWDRFTRISLLYKQKQLKLICHWFSTTIWIQLQVARRIRMKSGSIDRSIASEQHLWSNWLALASVKPVYRRYIGAHHATRSPAHRVMPLLFIFLFFHNKFIGNHLESFKIVKSIEKRIKLIENQFKSKIILILLFCFQW